MPLMSMKTILLAGAALAALTVTSGAHAWTVMPIGDSNTYGDATYDPSVAAIEGYRLPLDYVLRSEGISIEYVGDPTYVVPDASGTWISYSPDTRNPGYTNNLHAGYPGWQVYQLACGMTWDRGLSPDIGDPGCGQYVDAHSLVPMNWVSYEKPDMILLMAGTNDFIWGAPLDVVAWRMQYLLDVIHVYSPGSHVFLSSVFPLLSASQPELRDTVVQYNSFLAGEAASRAASGQSVSFVDNFAVLGPDDMAYDAEDEAYVHANYNGYANVAVNWSQHIASYVRNGTDAGLVH